MKHSPWGKTQSVHTIIAGMIRVTTASHGGIHLDPPLQKCIPVYMRQEDGWYEEDCHWAIPYVVLANRLRRETWPARHEKLEQDIASASETLKNWYWRWYELYFNVVLQPGESMTKDDDRWHEAHRGDYQVVTCWGDWHEQVPAGMVAVACQIGGRDHPHGMNRYYLLPAPCYQGGRTLPEYTYHRDCPPIH